MINLIYLHSVGFTQRALSRIFEHDENYKDFYTALSHESLRKLGFKEERIQTILQKKSPLSGASSENTSSSLFSLCSWKASGEYESYISGRFQKKHFLFANRTFEHHTRIGSFGVWNCILRRLWSRCSRTQDNARKRRIHACGFRDRDRPVLSEGK